MFGVIAQRGEDECVDECVVEFGVVDHIKSFGKINCLGQCVEWGTRLIKAQTYFMCKRQECTYGGVVGTEAMLIG